jgi:dTDP-4-dehydrorhamnose 3,5-epimerase
MIFRETELQGVFEVQIEEHHDERGFFARTWCQREFSEHGLSDRLVQCSVSFNKCRGTLRGMHFQEAPFSETKLVRCTRGSVYDVVIDLRPSSPTFRHWVHAELTAENHMALYIPEGVAHGFITLESDTEVYYQMSEFFTPAAARGVRWDDPAFGVNWPFRPEVISERDRTYPDFK